MIRQCSTDRIVRRWSGLAVIICLSVLGGVVRADSTAQSLPFAQDWSNGALLATADSWDGVPGIVGYRGDDLTTATGTDPRTLLDDGTGTPQDVNIDQTNPNTFTTGGVAEFRLADPVVALNGSGTADAPFLLISLTTLGSSTIRVAYTVRDIDGSADDAVQAVALQFRVGTSEPFTNVADAFIADATTGGQATLATPISVLLPPAADNQPVVQLRIITSNAIGNDEWVGIDDIRVDSSVAPQGPRVIAASAIPNPVEAGQGFVIAATVMPGVNPTSASLTVAADASGAGGAALVPLIDDGIAPDLVAGDLVFSGAAIAGNIAAGPASVSIAVVDELARTGTAQLTVQIVRPVAVLSIAEIQGNGAVSPYASQTVRTRGVVTAVKFNGLFIQSLPGTEDADPATSEGVFVFTSSASSAAIVEGDVLDVSGVVTEFVPSQDLASPSLTEITNASVVEVGTSPLPQPALLTQADVQPAGGLLQLEHREGMLVTAASLTVVAPTQGSVLEASATGTNNGLFFAVLTGAARPFREAGMPVVDPVPPCAAGANCAIAVFDLNPERLRIDSDAIRGVPAAAVASGTVLSNVRAVVDYGFRTWTLLPTTALVTSGGSAGRAARPAAADELTIASLNLQRFYDTTNDPAVDDVVLTAAAFETRLAKASLLVRAALGLPDILAVQEVENLTTLQALAARINADAGAVSPGYVAHLMEGNDIGGIDLGYLTRARVTVDRLEQVDAAVEWNDPAANNALRRLNDRPSLVLFGHVTATAPLVSTPIVVINNHLRSLNGLDSADPAERARVRRKRQLQAEGVAAFVQQTQVATPGVRMVVLGDFNAFTLNDGEVDVLGIVRGTPAPATEVVAFSADQVTPDLLDADEALPAAERYSYLFDGNAQSLDHVLFSPALSAAFRGADHARVSADFPESVRGDASHPLRLTDHDPAIVYFALARDTTPPVVTPPADRRVVAASPAGATVTYPTAAAVDDVDGPLPATCTPASGSVFAFGATTVTCTAVDGAGNTGRATFTVTVVEPSTAGLMVTVATVGAGSSALALVATAVERASTQAAAVVATGRSVQGQAGVFVATRIDAVGFFAGNAVRVAGSGAWNGVGGHTFQLIVEDRGTPGRGRDSVSMLVQSPSGAVVLVRSGLLTAGNAEVVAGR